MSEDLRKYLRCAIMLILIYAVIAIATSLLISCKANKHVERSHYENDSLAVVVNDIRFSRRWFEGYKADSTWENDYWHVKIYDTSKPIDCTTNLPPLLADVRHKKEEGNKYSEEVAAIDTASSITSSETLVTHEEVDEEDDEAVIESEKIPSWRIWTFVSFLVASVLMIKYGKNVIYTVTTSILNKIFK